MKLIIIIIFFLLIAGSVYAQQFEGVITYDMVSNTDNHDEGKFVIKGEKYKISTNFGTETKVLYIGTDSLAIVAGGQGAIMAKDSGMVFFSPTEFTDTLTGTFETGKKQIISSFHCTCTECYYTSGDTSELWITSEVDTALCQFYVRSLWNTLWQLDGTASYIKKLNAQNKMVVDRIGFGNIRGEMKIMNIDKRQVKNEEVDVPAEIKLTPLSLQIIKQSGK